MKLNIPINHPIRDKSFVLATDLDGTFLGGSANARETLYNWIEDNRETVGLVFVTGRHPEFIHDHCDAFGIPFPDFVIADVGTTIAQVHAPGVILPIPQLEAPIARAWDGKERQIRPLMDKIEGLVLQDTPFRHRLSYDISRDGFDTSQLAAVKALDVDVLISDNRFVDILPAGISKGPSLRRLLRAVGVAPGRVLTAGDTLNDISMLTEGFHAVAVGGSERALYDALPDAPKIHRARGTGAAGILEAVSAFNMHSREGVSHVL